MMRALFVVSVCCGAVGQVRAEVELVDSIQLGLTDRLSFDVSMLPEPLVADNVLGILRHQKLSGEILHVAPDMVRGLFETRATRTPGGDLLVMFPVGNHYAAAAGKVNEMISYRSSDNGRTWRGPKVAYEIEYSQHGFVPLIPRGTKRIYAFGTQPLPSEYSREKGRHENTPIGFRWSDDDGLTWSSVKLIRPLNDPGFLGMSVTRMCETDQGTWILGAHAADWSQQPLQTRQYLLRSEDQGETWTLLPEPRPDGWSVPKYHRMDEGRPIALGGGQVFFMARTPTGKLWTARSLDDGRTWSSPSPSTLVHPDAPPMVFHGSDRRSLWCFFHNRHIDSQYTGLSGKMDGMRDRSEIWVVKSQDGGRSWSEPRFLFANLTRPNPNKNGWFNYNVSYLDAVIEDGVVHLFCPHLWNRAVYMTISESSLHDLPSALELAAANPHSEN